MEALHMGEDMSDTRHIAHLPCPSTLETCLQEVDMCALDGKGGKATILTPVILTLDTQWLIVFLFTLDGYSLG